MSSDSLYRMPFQTKEYIFGCWMPGFHDTLDEAIVTIDGAKQAELSRLEEFVEGVQSLEQLAVVVNGEWIILNEKELTMAKIAKAKTGRDVAADLLGDDKTSRKNKATKKAVKKKAAKGGGGGGVDVDKKILIVDKDYSPREGTVAAKIFGCIKHGQSVKSFMDRKAKLKNAGDGNGLPTLSGLVRRGVVKIK